jgi:LuxR family maltose regulon positive regulatory protein
MLEGLFGLGFTLQMQGHLKRSAQIYSQVLQYAKENHIMWMRHVPRAYIRWSNVCYYWNDLARAEEYILQALRLCEQYGHTLNVNYDKIYLAQLRLAQGRDLAALEIIQEVERTVRQNQISAYNVEVEAHRAWIQARLTNRQAAAAWLETLDLWIGERLGYWQGVQGIQAAHVLVALDQTDKALDLLARLEAAAETSGSTNYLIEVLAIQAVVWHKRGETARALKALEDALVLAAPESHVQVFLNEGPPMARLLYEALTRGIAPDYARRLLTAFPVAEPEQAAPLETRAPESDLVEPLSERELKVLQLIAEGLTNPEIASRLFLALNTVKTHSSNIYGKLNVHSRTQAVARARGLGLLPHS